MSRRAMKAGRGKRFRTSLVPTTANLVLTPYAPTVTASSTQTVTPSTAALTLTTYAPTVTGPAPALVTPGTAALALATHAPTVAATQSQLVTPFTRTLTLTTYAPVINGAVLVEPTTAALTITRYAPTVAATAHKVVTPTPAALAITGHAPTVSSPNHTVVTPTTAALTTTRFAPTVTKTNNLRVTPTTKALTTTRYAPTVTTSAGSGASYYMAPSGSDAAAGTIGAPWASIQKFINTNPDPGDTLYLRGGNYTQSDGGHTGEGVGDLIGTASQPITIRNYPGETPVFPDLPGATITFRGNTTASTVAVNYVVLDGIRFTGSSPDDDAVIVIGNSGDLSETAYLVKNLTIRNCYFELAAGLASNDHAVGLVHGCEYITVEDCEFAVAGATNGDAFVIYSQPAARNVVVQRCIFHDYSRAPIQVWDYNTAAPTSTIQIKHCTFADNAAYDIDLRYHSTALIQDCVFDGPSTSAIYDPFNAAATTKDHNYYNQTLTGSYGLTAGSAAIDGAHDGSDAGAVPYP
jgi:hypothetical protein